jgi:ABC-type transport system involved in cytochrome bd biosynthesis fused ATPase/permease subunit
MLYICFGAVQFVQPFLMKAILVAINEKNNEGAKAPVAYIIALALCPLLLQFFECNSHRIGIHGISKLRAAICTLIYDKVLNLNIGTHSTIEAGHLLTIISFDARNGTEKVAISNQQLIFGFRFKSCLWLL